MSFKKNNKIKNGFLVFALGLIVSSVLSCDKTKSGDIEITLQSSKVNLFQADMVSCKALADQADTSTIATPDVQSISFEAPKITISTPSTKNIKLVYIGIQLTGAGISGNKFDCPVTTGDKLAASFKFKDVWDGDTTNTPKKYTTVPAYDGKDVFFPADNSAASTILWRNTTFCPVKCGGVNMVDKNKNYSGTGRIVVYGINTTDNEPNISEVYFDWDYVGAP
jgi:hypothetical protein